MVTTEWAGTNGGIPKNSRSSGICSEGNVPVREGLVWSACFVLCSIQGLYHFIKSLHNLIK